MLSIARQITKFLLRNQQSSRHLLKSIGEENLYSGPLHIKDRRTSDGGSGNYSISRCL